MPFLMPTISSVSMAFEQSSFQFSFLMLRVLACSFGWPSLLTGESNPKPSPDRKNELLFFGWFPFLLVVFLPTFEWMFLMPMDLLPLALVPYINRYY